MSENDMNKETPEQTDAPAAKEELSPELLARQQEKERFRREREQAMRLAPPSQRMPHSRAGRARFRMKRFAAKNRRLMLILLVTALAGLVLIISILAVTYFTVNGGSSDFDNSGLVDNKYQGNEADGTEQIKIIRLTDEVKLVEDVLITYVDKYNSDPSARNLLNSHKLTNRRLDYELDVTIEYAIDNLADRHKNIRRVYAIVSENVTDDGEYVSPTVFYANSFSQEDSIVCTHLKAGTQYFYKIVAEFSGGATLETEDGFVTKQSPRFVTVSNTLGSYLYNVRDIGGWMTVETEEGTKQVRQGLLYRGCELDGANDQTCTISWSSGVSTMVSSLGIRTVVDMRSQDEGGIDGYCPLGNSVKYVRIPGSYGYGSGPTLAEVNTTHEFIRKSFELLADPNNYPVYIHDIYGNKEVGMICYLLETVLGVDQTQRKKDFYMSEFSTKNEGIDSAFSTFTGMIRTYQQGNTEEEWVINFLTVKCGVTAEQINSIRDILLEDVLTPSQS